MDKNNSATKGFAILTVAGILNKVLSVLYVPVLLQILGGDYGYGIYSAGYRIYSFIYIITNSGFPIGISKLQAELIARKNYRDAKRSFRIIRIMMVSYGLVMAILTALFARQITIMLGYEDAYLVILALAPTMLFSAMSCSYRGFFNGNSNMKPTAISQVIEQFLNVTLSLAFALILKPYGVKYACAGATVGTTIGSLGSAIYLRATYNRKKHMLDEKTPCNIRPLSRNTIIKRLLSYAVPIAFSSIITYGGDIIDLANTKLRLLAAGFSSVKATKMFGVLTKYSTMLNVPLAITTAMYIAVMPYFSKAIELRDYRQLKRQIGDAYRMSLLISIPAAVGLAVLSKPIFQLLFPGFIDGWKLMAMGSIVVILASIVQIQVGMLQSVNKTNLSTMSLIIGLVIKLFMNYFLIATPRINIYGAVVGTIAFYGVAIYLNQHHIRKYVPAYVSIKKQMGRPIAASTAMAIAAGIAYKLLYAISHRFIGAYISNAISTLIAIIIAVIAYGLIMLMIGGITKEDLDVIPHSRKLLKFIPKRIQDIMRVKQQI